MTELRRIAAQVAWALLQGWRRLSATQQIMMRGVALFAVLILSGVLIGGWASRATASVDRQTGTYNGTAVISEYQRLRASLDTTSGELELVRLRLERAEELIKYSARYRIPADLAELVYDVALREGLDPELGFRLVNIESGFNVRAKSHADAYGLTQVQPATARFYEPEITVEQLLEPERNLHLGFRYLRDLLETYGDIRLALLAYNRGPTRVKTLLDQGQDPDNGYPSSLMEGYPGG